MKKGTKCQGKTTEKQAETKTAKAEADDTAAEARRPDKRNMKKEKGKGKRTKDERNDVRHTIYMDDRTWTADTVVSAIDPVEAWHDLSELVLLQENKGKVQLSANRKQDLEPLRQEARARLGHLGLDISDVVKPELEVLGMATVQSRGRSSLSKDEAKRVGATKNTILLLGAVPLSRRMRRYAYKALALPKLCYGWIAKALPAKEAKKIQTSISKGLRISSASSKWMKGILEGGDLYPQAALLQRAITVLQMARDANEDLWPWENKNGTLTAQVRKEMKNRGGKP